MATEEGISKALLCALTFDTKAPDKEKRPAIDSPVFALPMKDFCNFTDTIAAKVTF